jgi:phosphatidylserine/phosphatidylglycerophosphate/cardiolipin synthase-like enzyme
MRATQTANGLTVKAYAGSTGILLAFNLNQDAAQKGLLGFAIERREQGEQKFQWLCGMLDFPNRPHQPGALLQTNKAPVQKFRWSDYAVHPDTAYTYRVHAVYGQPDTLDVRPGVEIAVTTCACDIAKMLEAPGRHHVLFNRAAGGSQAFSRKFAGDDQKINDALKKNASKPKGKRQVPAPSAAALAWLSRGVKEGIIAFLNQAKDENNALDIAIYQYELEDIVDAVNAAVDRHVDVRLIYHAKPGDAQTTKNIKAAQHVPKACKVGRKTNAIFHHKFIVLSKKENGQRQPYAVLAGSTNFTFNGVYCQANDIHVCTDAAVADKYLDQFEAIFRGEDVKATKQRDTEENVLDPAASAQIGFSPRAGENDLSCFVALIHSAKQDVLFSTAFNMDQSIYDALAGQAHDSILRYGIQDKASKITGLHADRTADFEAAALLPKGLEGWLDEQRVKGQTGNILIHTKAIMVDFTSESPIIISGSHNFSKNASENNDENYAILRGNSDLADVFGCEILRIYDHYRYRYVQATGANNKTGKNSQKASGKKAPPHLTPDDSWTNDYFDKAKLKYADRLVFSGSTSNRDASAEVQAEKPRTASVQKTRAMAAKLGR